MKQFLTTMIQALASGEDLCMATVIASSGATPRGAGARMLVNAGGMLTGTVGGGAVEYRAVQMAKQVVQDHASFDQYFSLTKNDVQNLGMICGGDVSIYFHYLSAEDHEQIALLNTALTKIEESRDVWLISDLKQNGRLSLYTKEDGFVGIADTPQLCSCLRRKPMHYAEGDVDLFVEQIGSSGKVYVFGGGHVARELVPVLAHVGFRCIVVEDREEFTQQSLFPDAERIILCNFDEIDQYMTITEEDYVCVVTRGHARDMVVQAQVLPKKPYYLGVIGSHKKAAGVRARLKDEYGMPDELLDRVITPIGLPIKAETPAEIAISIASQMIQLRAERALYA